MFQRDFLSFYKVWATFDKVEFEIKFKLFKAEKASLLTSERKRGVKFFIELLSWKNKTELGNDRIWGVIELSLKKWISVQPLGFELSFFNSSETFLFSFFLCGNVHSVGGGGVEKELKEREKKEKFP